MFFMLHYLLLFCLIKNYSEPLSEEITGAVFKSKVGYCQEEPVSSELRTTDRKLGRIETD